MRRHTGEKPHKCTVSKGLWALKGKLRLYREQNSIDAACPDLLSTRHLLGKRLLCLLHYPAGPDDKKFRRGDSLDNLAHSSDLESKKAPGAILHRAQFA